MRPGTYQRESFAGRKAGALNSERIAQMKEFVETGMKKLDIPGVGLAFIDNGKIVYEGGLGVKELGKPDAVDANTLFMAASNTKGMTTLLLATLVDEGKVKWDDFVTKAYPKFKLGDAKTTEQVRIEHLICACTGLPRQDLPWLFEFRHATAALSMEMLGKMQPTSGFGEVFQYSNIMASGAGYVAGYLYNPKLELGAAYDEAMRKKIFEPLEMKSTTFDFARALKGNHASPHAWDVNGKQMVASMDLNYSIHPHRPAGGVWTSAHDLIRYVQLELAKGKLPNGKVLVSETNLLARRKPYVKVGAYRQLRNGTAGGESLGHAGRFPWRKHAGIQERHYVPARARCRRRDSDQRGYRRADAGVFPAPAPGGAIRWQARGGRGPCERRGELQSGASQVP